MGRSADVILILRGKVMNFSVAFFSFLSALLGAMGFGGGSVLIIYLTSATDMSQKEVQGINLVFFIATAFFALISNAKKGLVEKKALKAFIPFSLAGLAVGLMLLPVIPSELLKKLFGGALLLLGFKELFSKEHRR